MQYQQVYGSPQSSGVLVGTRGLVGIEGAGLVAVVPGSTKASGMGEDLLVKVGLGVGLGDSVTLTCS